MAKPGPAISHHPGCPVPAQAPRAKHVKGCRYRQYRHGIPEPKPDVQHRPRMTAEEAKALARARERGVDIVAALDAAAALQK